ncbi:MAG: amidohydrolase [Chloroflexi bacterium]|nr:MAG: amidohydrolase [Phototrophicales bacterium]RMF80098.1 MAG: amidohydrolase [Chloroflexota bacterium]
MKQVDTIIQGDAVITMNKQFDVIVDGAVAVKDADIIAVGTRDEILAHYEADNIVDCAGQYILPGLVNTHTHVPMTLLRGLADDLRLDVWLMGYIMPTEREFVTPEFCRLGTKIACAEMIRSGITSFADMYYYEADVAAATAEVGMRGVLGETILKFPAPDAESYDQSLAYTRRFIEEWRGHSLITPAIAPHAPYTVTDEMLEQCARLAAEFDVPLLIHISETALEVEDNIRIYGNRVIPRMQNARLFDARVLAAHCVHIDRSEMRMIRHHGATVAHCPSSNLKVAAGIAPIAEMLEEKLIVGIGTDGTSSNNALDMFEEVRLAAILAKTKANDPTAVPAKQALLMATRQGAEAMYLGDVTGSLEVGKRADIIVMDAHPVHNMPQFERDPDGIYARIVYAAKSTDVVHVMCNGQWLMLNRELLTLNETELLAQAADYARQIDSFLIEREGDILSKLLAIGGIEQGESYEVQAKAVLRDEAAIDRLLNHPDVEIVKHIHYQQYDTYFLFDEARLRYREDESIDAGLEVPQVRSRLTLTTPAKEHVFHSAVVLSHSRFIADADRSLRFYREYFQPKAERNLEKDRLRWHIRYKGVLMYVNYDRVIDPELPEPFIEIKSRTWSEADSEKKADLIQELLDYLAIPADDIVPADYLEMEGLAK